MNLKKIILKGREKFVKGLTDDFMMFYYKLKENEPEARKKCLSGLKNEFNIFYETGGFLSMPISLSLMIAYSFKRAYQATKLY